MMYHIRLAKNILNEISKIMLHVNDLNTKITQKIATSNCQSLDDYYYRVKVIGSKIIQKNV